jgi:short-chain fatty acids transporter
MLTKIGERFTDLFKKNMPDSFVFAIILTFLVAIISKLSLDASFIQIIDSWYKGFWMLLEFGMQMVLLIVTGYTIAISPFMKNQIDKLTKIINTPNQVYLLVSIFGISVSIISWGWIVIAAVLGRELALRVKGVHYPYLIACTYFANGAWVTGLSSSIPLLLNTENNYLIKSEILETIIPTTITLTSPLNLSLMLVYIIFGPILLFILRPKKNYGSEIKDLLENKKIQEDISIKKEADKLRLPFFAISDKLNNNFILVLIISFMGLCYIIRHFYLNGFDLNLNIMIFIFLILGLFLHKTPIRYGIAMRKTSSNVSSILFQFPFYAGIMGIMIHTGLGEELALFISETATINTYAFFSFLIGGIVNFAIPSGGGEFAVIGPSILEAVKTIGQGLNDQEIIKMLSRASLSIAYGETLTNLLQPFYLMLILPVMGAGINIQARDVMGFLVIPFLLFFVIMSLLITFVPI